MGVLSSLGIGSTSVDLVLPSDRLNAGESVQARVDVEGGSEEQTVEEIYFALRTRYKTEEGRHTATISEFALEEGFTVQPGESKTFDITIDVPPHTPTTIYGGTKVWIDTGLDIDWAADPDDKDEVTIEPPAQVEALHDAIGSLGFDLKGTPTVTATRTAVGADHAFAQEFEYRPVGEYRDAIEELEVVVSPGAEATEVQLVVDKPDSLISDRERRTDLTITTDDTEEVARTVEAAIDEQL